MQPVQNFADSRTFLRTALAEKFRAQPQLSLRAFARTSGVHVSLLSRVLSGRRRLTAENAHKISGALNLPPDESMYLLDLVELENVTNEQRRAELLRRMGRGRRGEGRVLPAEQFAVIADWYHFAILALVKTRGFRNDPAWIARRLGIRESEAAAALERVLQLGLLKRNGRRYEVDEDGNLETAHDVASAAVRENHSQQLQTAADALNRLPTELREFANITLPMENRNMAKAKQMIRKFLDRFHAEFEATVGDDVHQLNIQFYRQSRPAED